MLYISAKCFLGLNDKKSSLQSIISKANQLANWFIIQVHYEVAFFFFFASFYPFGYYLVYSKFGSDQRKRKAGDFCVRGQHISTKGSAFAGCLCSRSQNWAVWRTLQMERMQACILNKQTRSIVHRLWSSRAPCRFLKCTNADRKQSLLHGKAAFPYKRCVHVTNSWA